MTTPTLKPIDDAVYYDLAQDGARILFDVANFRLLDGWKDEQLSHFLLNTDSGQIYQMTIATAYDLLTTYHNGNRDYLYELLVDLEQPFRKHG